MTETSGALTLQSPPRRRRELLGQILLGGGVLWLSVSGWFAWMLRDGVVVQLDRLPSLGWDAWLGWFAWWPLFSPGIVLTFSGSALWFWGRRLRLFASGLPSSR